jgi:cytochrome c-type biogenesis protein CcmH/NrfF
MPWPVSSTHDEWGPAWVVSLFDGLARENVSLWRAGAPLLAVLLLALLLAGAEVWRQRRKQEYLQSEE